jgi:hypothetical protein
MKAFSNEVVDRKMLSEVIKSSNVSQVYHRFENLIIVIQMINIK